ncbi:MAG: AraC family transcriptional regulator [Akkermansiaceae bacterium]|nr:AraC family transcriptional regulator [Akkermansiaceae bacterium]
MKRVWQRWLEQMECPLGRVVEAGEIRHSPGGMVRFRYLSRYAVMIVTRGEGIYEDEEGRQRSLVAGDWVLVLPDLGHSYRPLMAGGWDEIYVMFEGPVFDLWRQRGLLGPSRLLGRVDDAAAVRQGLLENVVEAEGSALTRFCAFQSWLAGVLEGGMDAREGEKGIDAWFQEACRKLSQPGARVQQVAGELGMGYESFRKSFRAQAGVSPHRYHLQQVINRAASMLEATSMKSADIAHALGFCDEPYFSRVFRKTTGRSPSEYRGARSRKGPKTKNVFK